MMLTTRHSVLLLIATLGLGYAAPRPTTAADDGFIAMFNGQDFSGWVVEGANTSGKGDGAKPIWSVENGNIVASGKGYGFVRYDVKVSDFVFEVEYRLSKSANSGVGIRTVPYTGSVATRPSFAAYEIQILDDASKPANEYSSGSLYRYVPARVNATLPTGQWNKMHLECRGPKILITLNDKTIQDLDQTTIDKIKDKPLSGYLCLQSHNNRVEFRNPRFKKLE